MSDEAAATAKPRQKAFIKRFRSTPLPVDRAKRQGSIAQLAFSALGREEALSFLNTLDETMSARPLDLAMESPAGYSVVEAAVHRLARRQVGDAG